MWRELTEEEKKIIFRNQKIGIYLIRIAIAIWLIFMTCYSVSCVKDIAENPNTGQIIFFIFMCIVFYGGPIIILKFMTTAELTALEQSTLYRGNGEFIDSTYFKTHGGRTKSYATVRLIDEQGNRTEKVTCRTFSDLDNVCKAGEIVTVLKVKSDEFSNVIDEELPAYICLNNAFL